MEQIQDLLSALYAFDLIYLINFLGLKKRHLKVSILSLTKQLKSKQHNLCRNLLLLNYSLLTFSAPNSSKRTLSIEV